MKATLTHTVMALAATSTMLSANSTTLTQASLPLIESQHTTLYPLVVDEQVYWLKDDLTGQSSIHNVNGKPLANLPTGIHTYAYHGTGDHLYLSTDDDLSGTTQLWRFSPHKHTLSLLATTPTSDAQTTGMCIGTVDGSVALVKTTVTGLAQQYVYNEAAENLRLVREFPVGGEIGPCAINSTSGDLYIGEEEVGIWQYQAHPESESTRTLITVAGLLEPDSLSIDSHHNLVVVSEDDDQVAVIAPDHHVLAQFKHTIGQMRHQSENGQVVSFVTPNTVNLAVVDGTEVSFAQLPYVSAPLLTSTDDKPKGEIPPPPALLHAYTQTTPVSRHGDAADDPEVWVNHRNPEASLVLGTDKMGALNVYDLTGKQVQSLPIGKVNNVDIRYNLTLPDGVYDIAAASNRTTQSISLFKIDPHTGVIQHWRDNKVPLSDIYGLCMYDLDAMGVIANSTDGKFISYHINTDGTLTLVSTFSTQTQPEGCVVNDVTGDIFYGEEEFGIWSNNLLKDSKPKVVSRIVHGLAADIEGMSLYWFNQRPYLIVSSQGNNSYGVLSAEAPFPLLGTFKLAADYTKGIDGVSETDGLATTSVPLGDNLPYGLMVVQDGHNVMPNDKQNFKLVDGNQLRSFIQAQQH